MSFHRWVLAGVVLLGAMGCPDDPVDTTDTSDTAVVDPGDPVVVVQGAFMVALGDTAQLTANTVNADVETYTWSSGATSVVTVDETGLATAVGLGEAVITATGADSGVSGELGIVVTQEVPYLEDWASSGHADRTAEAFIHWDEDGEIPASCAGCHSRTGFLDRIGADGTAADSVDGPHALGTVIDCETCHNPGSQALDHVVFPSGAVIEDLGPEARCMTCHQGRESSDSVNAAIEGAAVGDDTTSTDLGFKNIHYYAAAATLYASQARGGYQYDGQVYDYKFRHVAGIDTCVDCHNAHTLELEVEVCSECHAGVTSAEDAKDIRMIASSLSDYDGDGDLTEGLSHEIDGLKAQLLMAIVQYPVDMGNDKICYSSSGYPYYFIDTDGNGECSSAEANFGNRYVAWTPRLLRAAYNYQVAGKDPGGFAHNGKYMIQLLHDSLQDINGALNSPADLSALQRNDPGHFNGAGEAARHWDEDEAVSGSCSRCHGGAEGVDFFLEYGVGSNSVAPDNGLECETCHVEIPGYALRLPASIQFPSGVTIANEGRIDNLCGTCHVGRESMASVDARIASGSFGFRNVHYLPAAATRYGTDAKVGYEFPEKNYAGEVTGHVGGDRCTDCHSPVGTGHTFQVTDDYASCATCHVATTKPQDIRATARKTIDYDGDGSSTESLEGELDGLADRLIDAIYDESGDAICYDAHAYPYWFKDNDGSGPMCNDGEGTFSNSFRGWTAPLMRATFNYQFWSKETGAYAHNFDYMAQLLIDATESLDGNISGTVRP
jgi:hypothetical protein